MLPSPRRAREGHSAGKVFVLLVLGLGLVIGCTTVSGAAPEGSASPPSPALLGAAGIGSADADAGEASPLPDASLLVPGPTLPTRTEEPAPTSTRRPAPIPTPAPSASPSASVAATAGLAGPPTSGGRVRPSHRVAQDGLDGATRRRLQRILRNTVRKRDIAGLQVAVRLPGGQTWLGTAGNAEFRPSRPVRDDTVFAIASVTKTFIAALILQLAEEGELGLDETFGRYESDAPRGKKVTIRQLLSHTSGIYDYFGHPRYVRASGDWVKAAPSGMSARDHQWTYDEILGLLKPGYCKPGRCYRYSNTNYVILGRVAEAAGGAPLHEQLRERFFEPLGLDDTFYQPAEVPPMDAAHGHWPTGNGGHIDHTRDARVLPFMAAVSAAGAAGAIASTADDLATWAAAVYGGDVLSPASLRQMTTILEPGYYGLGTDVAVFAGNRAFGHRGGVRGFESSMWYFPHTGISIALLSNQGNWFLSGTSTDVPMKKLVKAVMGKGPGG